jgi:hypothetical protein
MTIKSMRDALNEALHHEFERDPRVFLIGEDVGGFEKDGQPVEIGGVFGVSKGLYRKYGRKRVIDAPISEAAIIGAASGAALCGMRPIAEIMFADLTAVCFDQIVNQIAKFRYMFGGQCACPVVIRMTTGGGRTALADLLPDLHQLPRPQDRGPIERLRCQGPVDQRDPRRGPGAVLRAQGALHGKVRGPGRGLRYPFRRSRYAARGRGRHARCVRTIGELGGAGRRRTAQDPRHPLRCHRSAHAVAAR